MALATITVSEKCAALEYQCRYWSRATATCGRASPPLAGYAGRPSSSSSLDITPLHKHIPTMVFTTWTSWKKGTWHQAAGVSHVYFSSA
jgi:hypothetical protein